MPTPFSDLYPVARTLLGDTGTLVAYSNDQLDMGLRLGLLQEDGFSETTTVPGVGDQSIEPAVSAKTDKLRIAVRCAIALLEPGSDQSSYRTPMLSVSRQPGMVVNGLKTLLRKLESDGYPVLSDNEFDQFIRGNQGGQVQDLLSRLFA